MATEQKPKEEKAVEVEVTVTEAAPEEQEQAVVAYYYLPENNPDGASYPGVPLGDILQHVYDAQPKWIQKSIAANPMYSEEKPGSRRKAR